MVINDEFVAIFEQLGYMLFSLCRVFVGRVSIVDREDCLVGHDVACNTGVHIDRLHSFTVFAAIDVGP